jgi:hypothetical protein
VVKYFFSIFTVNMAHQLFKLTKQYELADFKPTENMEDLDYKGSVDYKQSRPIGSIYLVADGKLVQIQRSFTGKGSSASLDFQKHFKINYWKFGTKILDTRDRFLLKSV